MVSRLEAYLSPAVLANQNSIARTIQSISSILLVASLLAGVVTAFDHNWDAVRALGILILPLGATFWLSRQGQASVAIFVLAVSLLVLSTILATLGQGIHDVTNFVYPGILLISSLVLNKRAFFLLTALALVAVGWLVLGAMSGLFVPHPPDVGALSDLLIVSVILITTAFCAYFLSNNLQRSLLQANAQMLERQQTEQALRESQTMLQLVFDHAFDGISVYEEFPKQGDRRLIDCNTRYAAMAGRSKEELLAIGNTLPIQKDVGDLADHTEFIEHLNRGAYMGRFSWLRPDGCENVIEYTAVPRRMNDHLLVIGVDHDITVQLQAAQERETMIRELKAKNTELERFTYTVSHDLKSPLITIKGFLGFLEQDAASGNAEQLKKDIAFITGAADKMRQLLDELLEFSRIGRLDNPFQAVPMTELVHEAADLVAGQLTARGVQVDIAPNMPVVYGDRPRLREIFENLLSNAAKYMGDQAQPHVEIGTRQEGERLVFYVRDNGTGIAPQYHDKVFGLFEKLDPASEGTGIGLAIVKRAVETHGGKIWIESQLGQGAMFCMLLPIISDY